MNAYRRVTFEDRCQIKAHIGHKLTAAGIARKLGFHKSTITRELKRNDGRDNYCAKAAEARAIVKFISCRRKKLICGELEKVVYNKLGCAWSPEQIAGRWRHETGSILSHQTIYDYAYEKVDDQVVRRGLRKYKKRGPARLRHRKVPPWRVPISKRPNVINNRRRLGDWERDLFYAKGEPLIACTDRKSRFVKIEKVIKPSSIYLTEQTKRLLESTGKLLSLTNDNGPEFEDAKEFEVPVYYCEPRKPHQRGTVENTIGLVRQFIKRTTNIASITDQDIKRIEDALNYRPRKCLDYKTPHEVFYGLTVALVS